MSHPGGRKALECPGYPGWKGMGRAERGRRFKIPGFLCLRDEAGLGKALLECVGRIPEGSPAAQASLGCFPGMFSCLHHLIPKCPRPKSIPIPPFPAGMNQKSHDSHPNHSTIPRDSIPAFPHPCPDPAPAAAPDPWNRPWMFFQEIQGHGMSH